MNMNANKMLYVWFKLQCLYLDVATHIALSSIVLSFDLPDSSEYSSASYRQTSTVIYFVHMIWEDPFTL